MAAARANVARRKAVVVSPRRRSMRVAQPAFPQLDGRSPALRSPLPQALRDPIAAVAPGPRDRFVFNRFAPAGRTARSATSPPLRCLRCESASAATPRALAVQTPRIRRARRWLAPGGGQSAPHSTPRRPAAAQAPAHHFLFLPFPSLLLFFSLARGSARRRSEQARCRKQRQRTTASGCKLGFRRQGPPSSVGRAQGP